MNSEETINCLLHSRAGLAFSLWKVPDPYQRQDRGKNHEQANRSPLSIWIFHVHLLRADRTKKCSFRHPKMFLLTLVRPEDGSLLVDPALDYHSFFFRVNQIIPRRNHSQTIYPIPRFRQTFDRRYPKRGSVSKSFENIEFRRHFESPV
jgi:hypothetical protein